MEVISGLFEIVNVATGSRLDVRNSQSHNGNIVQAWSLNGTNAQRWLLVNAPAKNVDSFHDQSFRILSKVNDNFAIISNPNITNNVQMVTFSRIHQVNWRFNLNPQTNTYTITNVHPNIRTSMFVQSGANLTLTTTLSPATHWRIIKTENGLYEIVNAQTGDCITINGSSGETLHGVVPRVQARNGTINQQFALENIYEPNTRRFNEHNVQIMPQNGINHCITSITNQSVSLINNTGATNQVWNFNLINNLETYTISLQNGFLIERTGNLAVSAISGNPQALSQWRVVEVLSGVFEVVNEGSGRRIARSNDGRVLELQRANGSKAQRWRITSNVLPNSIRFVNRSCRITTLLNGQSVLDFSQGADRSLVLANNNGASSQTWNFSLHAPTSTYTITNATRRGFLNESPTGGLVSMDTFQGTEIPNRYRWNIVQIGVNAFEIINALTGNRLNPLSFGTSQNTIVHALGSNRSISQLWQINDDTTINEPLNFLDNGRFNIRTGLNQSLALDVASQNNIILWNFHNNNNQRWIFIYERTTNSYTIRSVSHNMYLANFGINENQISLQSSITDNARWVIILISPSVYEIINRAIGRRLTLGAAISGSSVTTALTIGQLNQGWRFVSN